MVLGTGGSQDLGIHGISDAVLVDSGGSSRIYRALQGQLGRVVAVKVLLGTAPNERRQFDRESKALGRLSSHPGIVSVHDAGLTTAGDPYLVLEYCSGGSLSQRLSQGVLPWTEAIAYLAPVAETLAHSHASGLVHRDLKPGNILLDDHGRALVADFGLARLIDAEDSFGQASIAAFTPGFVPPETINGSPPSTAGDIYSLGGTLYALLTAEVPFVDSETANNIVALARRVTEDPITDLRPAGIPDAVCTIIERCMAKDPAQRPSADDLARMLRAAQGHQSTGFGANTLHPDAPSSSAGAVAPPRNTTIHLSPDELHRPIETVAPESLANPAVAAPGPSPAPPVPVVDHGATRPSRRDRRRAQKLAAAAPAAAVTPPPPSPAIAPPGQPALAPAYQVQPAHYAGAHANAGLPVAGQSDQYLEPDKPLRRTRALLFGVLLGLLVLALMIGGVVAYYLIRGEELPTISIDRKVGVIEIAYLFSR